jgi:hypothetical protein
MTPSGGSGQAVVRGKFPVNLLIYNFNYLKKIAQGGGGRMVLPELDDMSSRKRELGKREAKTGGDE